MGILSFGLGLCAGYYLKYRGLTKELERRVLVMTKVIFIQYLIEMKFQCSILRLNLTAVSGLSVR